MKECVYSISSTQLETLKAGFEGYFESFRSDDPDRQRNFDLKATHTGHVCEEILLLGREIRLSDEDLRLAEAVALFHDIGRFEQYRRYGTFHDLVSVDHADLGVSVIMENTLFECLDEETRDLALRVIAHHNKLAVPDDEDETCLFFTKLLRDADKLDIWRVVTDYYREKEKGGENCAIELDLPDLPGITGKVYRDLLAGRNIRFVHLKTLNDFKLVQLGWAFDVNFAPTFRLLDERGYLEIIRDVLPPSLTTANAYYAVRHYVDKQMAASER